MSMDAFPTGRREEGDGKMSGEERTDKTDQQSSIKLHRNGKGEWAMEVKIYEDDAIGAMAKLERYVRIAKDRIAAEIADEKGVGK